MESKTKTTFLFEKEKLLIPFVVFVHVVLLTNTSKSLYTFLILNNHIVIQLTMIYCIGWEDLV